jgi:ubiquinone/menaquinone biosynthesis C-methylase UbiE
LNFEKKRDFMTTLGILCIGAVGFFLGVFILWGVASHRRKIPCPTWLSWMVERDNPFAKNNTAPEIIRSLDLRPGMKVLDAGCGPGRLIIPIAERIGPAGEVTAMDIQSGMLDRVRIKAQRANLENIRFIQGGIGEEKLERNVYDRALLVTVLGEIPERVTALKEIFAALIPGGILTVTEIVFDPHFQKRDTVIRLAQEAGFREKGFFGKWFAYTINLEKPAG